MASALALSPSACRSAAVSREPIPAVGETSIVVPRGTSEVGRVEAPGSEERSGALARTLDDGVRAIGASGVAADAPATNDGAGERAVLVFGGDVSFGREVGQGLVADARYTPFSPIAPLWADADFRFVNLESQLSEQGGETQSPRNRLIFTGPPAGAQALARAGVHVASTANNHAWDYGRGALFETLANLAAAGVKAVGTGVDLEAAYRPASFVVRGRRIAVLAVTHVWNQGPFDEHEGRDFVAWAKLSRVRTALSKARETSDFVVLSYHGGAEYQDAPSPQTKRFTKAVMDAGADLVIGHHPHVIQGIGWSGERPIFYSLGNLVFGPRPPHPWTKYGMLARVTLEPDGTRRYAICPYEIIGFEPTPFRDAAIERRDRFFAQVRNASTAVGGVTLGTPDSRGCVDVAPPAARKRAERGDVALR